MHQGTHDPVYLLPQNGSVRRKEENIKNGDKDR
jgi:hypothetical protein